MIRDRVDRLLKRLSKDRQFPTQGRTVFIDLERREVRSAFAPRRLVDVFLGADLSRWSVLFSQHDRRFVLATIAGAWIAIEPFWIAANVVLVRKAGAAETGEDLRVWFEELRQS